jgi:hypothetical protein
MRLFPALLVSAVLTGSLFAQTATQSPLGPEGETRVGIRGISISPVAGKPFSGSDSVDWTRTLADGTVVAMHQDAKLARDSQGRMYRENVTRFPANSGLKSSVREIILYDPVAHTRTTCAMAERHCEVTAYSGTTESRAGSMPKTEGTFNNGRRSLTRENLGTDTIDGLSVIVTRETVTTSAGVEGNSQPVVSSEESWYSPDLEVNLMVTRKDPLQGTIVIHVVDLSRSEPDASLFQVPANFVVDDHRQSR